MIFTIAQHEWVKLFKTGKLWKLLALCQFILGLIFYWLIEEFILKTKNALLENPGSLGITEEVIHPLFAWTTLLFFFVTSVLTIHSLTQEKKMNMLNLYFTAAVSTTDIIIGKFIGLLAAEIFLLLPIVFMPGLMIVLQNQVDIGYFLCGILGLLLVLSAILSLGIFVASLAKEPLVAALVILILLFLLSLLEWMAPFLSVHFSWLKEVALLYHCKNFFSGIIHSRDIIYYGAFSCFFLYLAKINCNRE